MEAPFEAGGIRGFLHGPDVQPAGAIALTHGAGSNCRAPLLVRLAEEFASLGCLALRYDLAFRRDRPKGPPFPSSAAHDRDTVRQAVQALRARVKGPVFAGGHSYGGRQTTIAASEHPGMADALLLLSYPLHPPKRPGDKRTAHFPDLRTPALFVHGTADPFGTVEELREALGLVPARTDLLAVEGAAHDLSRAVGLAPEILTHLRALVAQ